MSFRQKHQPASVSDLVFRDPSTAQIVHEYANGTRPKHLLLEGPTSSGKSEAARMILKERLCSTLGLQYSSIYHGQGFNTAVLNEIECDWNLQVCQTNWAFSVIDEVDFAGTAGSREIRKFIDRKNFGTLICTTNNLHKLETAFVSRFRVVKVQPPLPADWHQRALTILQSEGHAVTMIMIQTLFANFTGHARDFMDLVEDAHINLSRSSPANASRTMPSPANRPAVPGVSIPSTLKLKTTVSQTTPTQSANPPTGANNAPSAAPAASGNPKKP